MPAPGAGGVQTSLVGTVQGMVASARSAASRHPSRAPGDKNNPADLTQFFEDFEPLGRPLCPVLSYLKHIPIYAIL